MKQKTPNAERREEALSDLINFSKDISVLKDQIIKFNWDSESEIITMTPNHLKDVLRKYLNKEISATQIYEWANLIEIREDIGCSEEIKDLIFRLANPEINGEINSREVNEILNSL